MDPLEPKPAPKQKERRLAHPASLPERSVRAGAALAGGLVHEAAEVVLPDWLRRSRLYQATVARMLRITVELIGGVQDVFPEEEVSVEELAVRKAAGNVVELAGVLAVGWSPLWLLAATADLTGGARIYLRTLVEELKRSGLLDEEADIQSVEDLLDALERTSGLMADTIDIPPLNVEEMRRSWEALQRNRSALPDGQALASLFSRLREVAAREGRSLFSVSSLLAAGAVRAGIQLGNTHVFDYYRETLNKIDEEGVLAYVRRVARPYLEQSVRHFDPDSPTLTERFLQHVRNRRSEDRHHLPERGS